MTPKAGCLFGKEGSPLNPYHSYLYVFQHGRHKFMKGVIGSVILAKINHAQKIQVVTTSRLWPTLVEGM